MDSSKQKRSIKMWEKKIPPYLGKNKVDFIGPYACHKNHPQQERHVLNWQLWNQIPHVSIYIYVLGRNSIWHAHKPTHQSDLQQSDCISVSNLQLKEQRGKRKL